MNCAYTSRYLFTADTDMTTEGAIISGVNSNMPNDMVVAKDLKPATCVLTQIVIAFLENG